jgi:hypothetical protein
MVRRLAVGAMFANLRAMLSEIFDESAYERYLKRNHAPRNAASYRDFLNERSAMMSRKPRCC